MLVDYMRQTMIEWTTQPDLIAAMTDSELCAAYQRTDGQGAEAEALPAEIERRVLDI